MFEHQNRLPKLALLFVLGLGFFLVPLSAQEPQTPHQGEILIPTNANPNSQVEKTGWTDPPLILQRTPMQTWIPVKSSARVTWLPGSGDDVGMSRWNVSTTFMQSLPNRTSMINVSPSFSMTTLNGPVSADLPPRLYSTSVNLSWMSQINERMNLAIGISPGINSDFENTSSEAFLMMGFASGTWQYHPEWQIQFGVAVLGRSDIPALPLAGLIWTPNEDTRVEFAAPRPRYSRRIARDGEGWLPGDNWVYVAGEFGGGTWAIQRQSGLNDTVTLRDFRLVMGYETKAKGRANWQMEGGYVLGREIEYDSRTPDIEPGDTFLLRTGLSF